MATEQSNKEPRQTAEKITELKQKYVEYFRDVPVQKYAAMYVGRTEQTIIDWKREDEDFNNRVQEAHAEWVQKTTLKAKAEFTLERLEREIFAPPKQEVEATHNIDPLADILKKFDMGKEEGKDDDRKNDEATSGSSPSDS
jgi:hypothetical protein